MAHIGVLKVLDELRVPIDAIAGTSMGAIVGGLYASGMSAAEIEETISSIDWQDAFDDRVARDKLAFRRKQDDLSFLVRFPLGIKDGDFVLPRGLIQGQKLNQMLRTLTLPVSSVESFDDLPIPFRAVATNLETGEGVVMGSGDLAAAMRASMSAPGVFAPVEFDDQLLVDGGIAENLPIDVARRMGVDVLVVVDVSFPLLDRRQLGSAIEVSNQMLAILVRRNSDLQRQTLGANDVVIDPPLGSQSSGDFALVKRAIAAGEWAAREQSGRLAALALAPEAYERHVANRKVQSPTDVTIDFVRADPDSQRYAKLIDAMMKPFIGRKLDLAAVGQRLESLYGRDIFETVDYHLVTEPGLVSEPASAPSTDGDAPDAARYGLEVRAIRKSWGPNYVRFGLSLQDDFEGNNNFNAAARFIVTEINDLGAEWVTDVQVGENPRFFSEFYQPLTYVSRYFIAPQVNAEIRNLQILDEEDRIAEYRLRSFSAGLDVGREFGNWGELRTGIRRGHGTTRLRIGDPSLPEEDIERGAYFVRLAYDKLDNVNFPRNGGNFSVQWTAGRRNLGDDNNSDQLELDALIARTFGRHTLLGWVSTGSTLDSEDADLQDLFALGGLFQLSGRRPFSVVGPHYAIARALYYRQIGRSGPGFLNVPAYAGLSFEVGNAFERRSDVAWDTSFRDVSLFLGLDTFFGPLYLAGAYDDAGETAFYLFLGRPF
jgi:NTE family protein